MSQGPGWWFASNGKWYPPHLHPNYEPPPPPPRSASTFAPSKTRVNSGRQAAGGAWLAIISGGWLITGALMPWLTATSFTSVNLNAFQLQTHTGLTWYGPACLGLGVVAGIIGISRYVNAGMPLVLARASILLGLGAGITVVAGAQRVHSLIQSAHSPHALLLSYGYGLWMAAVGVIGLFVAGLLTPATRHVRTARRSPMPPGWYGDPDGSSERRWWDGTHWGPVEPAPSVSDAGSTTPLPPFQR